MIPRRLVALAVAAAVAGAACGDDADEARGPVTYEVVLVVGAAFSHETADESALPAIGSDFAEPWILDCDDDACLLRRTAAPPLGDLEQLRLTSEDGRTYRGAATGVGAVPDPDEPSPCHGSPAETWTVDVELTRDDDRIVGSVFRIPDALLAGDCLGIDLTLGFSSTTRR